MKFPKISFNKNLILIFSILTLAGFLRLYRISDYLTFLGDEGRDVLVAKGILEGHFTLLGPRASAGDFFLGPIYYYMMAPFLWVWRLDPVGPAIMVAIFGISTVFLIYKISKEFFGLKAAVVSSILYSISPLVIAYSRSSWNPNPMPFFSLLTLYLTYKTVKIPSLGKLITIGFLLGISLQLHYLATFLVIIVFAFILFSNFYLRRKLIYSLDQYFKITLGFIIGFSPFLIFEIRHGFPNTKTIFNFIFSNALSTNFGQNISFIEILKDVFFRVFGRLVTFFPPKEQIPNLDHNLIFFWQLFTVLLGLFSVLLILKMKNKVAALLFGCWIFFGIFLFGFYKKPIYDYYFGFMFPLPFILVGNFLSQIFEQKKFLFKLVSVIIFLFLLGLNLYNNPFRYEPNRQKEQVKTISEFVLSKTDNKPFNFALISKGNSDYAYRYFFEILDKSPVHINNLGDDPQRKSVTDQLLVVCEGECHPLGDSSFDVSNFGRAEIEGEWNVSVVKIFKLVHYIDK